VIIFLILFTLGYSGHFLYQFLNKMNSEDAEYEVLNLISALQQKYNEMLGMFVYQQENIAVGQIYSSDIAYCEGDEKFSYKNQNSVQKYMELSENNEINFVENQGNMDEKLWNDFNKFINEINSEEFCKTLNENSDCELIFSGIMKKGMRSLLFTLYSNINTIYNMYTTKMPTNSAMRKMIYTNAAYLQNIDIFNRFMSPALIMQNENAKTVSKNSFEYERQRLYIECGILLGIVILSVIYIGIFVIRAMQRKIVSIRKLLLILPLNCLKNKGKEIDSILAILS